MEINNTDKFVHEKKKKFCAVRNPLKRSYQSWFYNNFLGNLLKKKQERNKIKVNWLMELTDDEIELLKEKTCVVLELDNNLKEQIEKNIKNNRHGD